MKLQDKSIFILFLIISSSILSVHSNIKFSEFSSRQSDSLKFVEESENNGRNSNLSDEFSYNNNDAKEFREESSSNSLNIIMIDNNIEDFSNYSENEKAYLRLFNFVLGLAEQTEMLREYIIIYEGVLDNDTNPECSREKLMEEFYKPHITAEERKEAALESWNDLYGDFAKTNDVIDVDWSNPKNACYTVKNYYQKKFADMTRIQKDSNTLWEAAKRAWKNGSKFHELEAIEGGFLMKIFHMQTSILIQFIQELNFKGDAYLMRETYKDYKRWRKDLRILIEWLRIRKEAAEEKKASIQESDKEIISCDYLPTTNKLQDELPSFTENFIGGLLVLKQLAICFNIDVLAYKLFKIQAIKSIINFTGHIFGLNVAKILFIAIQLYQFSGLLYKAIAEDESKHLTSKWRNYGRAAGVMANIIGFLLKMDY